MRVGILQSGNREKGIGKCAQTIAWAARRHEVTLFPVRSFYRLATAPTPEFVDWTASLDVLIAIEQFLPAAMLAALQRKVRVVFVPNLDWAVLPGDNQVSRWIAAVQSMPVEVWSRTKQIQNTLAASEIPSKLIPWSIPDPVNFHRVPRRGTEVVFFMNAGRGGWRRRRGADIALGAFRILCSRRPKVRLILKTLQPVAQIAGEWQPDPRVSVIEGWQDQEAGCELQRQADVVLHPSRWEGLGLPLLEALHDGLPVIATDGWPMNELAEDHLTGLLAPARRVGPCRLAVHWECDAESLASVMQRIVDDVELRARLTCPCPEVWVNRQEEFVAIVGRALTLN